MRALIFEDEYIIAESLRATLLDQTSIKSVTITHSLEKLQTLLSENNFDLAFLDVNICGRQDGILAGQFIRKFFSMSIIYLTAYSDDHLINEIAQVNPDAYLLKPYDEHQVVAVTKQIIAKKSSINSFGSIELTSSNGTVSIPKFEMYQTLFDQIFLISITDNAGTILYTNEEFAKMNGYASKELIGKNHRYLSSKTHSQEFFEQLWKTILSGDIWIGDIKNQRKDGSHYWVKSYIFPLHNKTNPESPYFVSLRIDITKMKEDEAALKEMINDKMSELSKNRQNVALLWKEESLSGFNSVFVHELKRPLSTLSLQLDQLLRRYSENFPPKLTDGLQRTRSNLTHTAQLINYLNQTFRRKSTDAKVVIPLLGVLESAIAFTQTLFSLDLIAFELSGVNQSHKIIGYTDAVFLAVFNLLKNACEAFPKNQIQKTITLRVQDDENAIHLYISDNIQGGIPKNAVNNLFNIMSSTKEGGSGLGLHLTRNFLAAMDTSIELHSTGNEGSIFHLIFNPEQQSNSGISQTEIVRKITS